MKSGARIAEILRARAEQRESVVRGHPGEPREDVHRLLDRERKPDARRAVVANAGRREGEAPDQNHELAVVREDIRVERRDGLPLGEPDVEEEDAKVDDAGEEAEHERRHRSALRLARRRDQRERRCECKHGAVKVRSNRILSMSTTPQRAYSTLNVGFGVGLSADGGFKPKLKARRRVAAAGGRVGRRDRRGGAVRRAAAADGGGGARARRGRRRRRRRPSNGRRAAPPRAHAGRKSAAGRGRLLRVVQSLSAAARAAAGGELRAADVRRRLSQHRRARSRGRLRRRATPPVAAKAAADRAPRGGATASTACRHRSPPRCGGAYTGHACRRPTARRSVEAAAIECRAMRSSSARNVVPESAGARAAPPLRRELAAPR